MRLLLDECIPRKFKNSLRNHDCRTVPEEGWAGKKNGELLDLAENSGFRAFVSIDRGIEFQQNLNPRRIAVILIRTKSNRLADLVAHIPKLIGVLQDLQAGQLIKLG
jgi:Domain of unknown function (DUF5615)